MTDQPGPNSTIEGVAASQQALDEFLSTSVFDPAEPSSLPGWSIGHVLTHIARNADSHVQMLLGSAQYGGEPGQRDAAIEAGSGRDRDALIADVEASSAAWTAAWNEWATAGGVEQVELLGGAVVDAALAPLLRWREVEIHRVDLGLGYGFNDLPAEYVRRDVRQLEMVAASRGSMGLNGLPDAARRAAPAERLAWLLGRTDIDGAPTTSSP